MRLEPFARFRRWHYVKALHGYSSAGAQRSRGSCLQRLAKWLRLSKQDTKGREGGGGWGGVSNKCRCKTQPSLAKSMREAAQDTNKSIAPSKPSHRQAYRAVR